MSNSVLLIHGQQLGSFDLTGQHLNSFDLVLNGYRQHEQVGCDDKIDTIRFTDDCVILFTTNGVEIKHDFDETDIEFSSINSESGIEGVFFNYRSAYEYQFITEVDVISESKNPYLQISDVVSDTFSRLSDSHLQVIFNVDFTDKTPEQRNQIIKDCKENWDELSWNEIMQILNDIWN